MTDVLEGRIYRAKVGFVSTLSGFQDIKFARILVLRCNIFSADAVKPPLAVKVYWNRKTHSGGAPVKGDTILVRAYRDKKHGPIRFKPATPKQKDDTMAISEQKMLGYVSWAPNHQACYVRVNIPDWKTDIPLSIKATFSDFNRCDLKKDDAVEVERTDRKDARRFKIVRLLKPVTVREDKPMAMSKDRVRFFIREQYFSTQAKRLNMAGVMVKAFGVSEVAAASWLLGNGAWITCRPSQFARFMIYRNEANIVNGFMDLRAELVENEPQDMYDRLADKAGVDRETAKKVSLALSFDADDIESTLTGQSGGELDVSQNAA